MQAWQLQDGFGVENLRCVDRASREPGPFEVKLRIRATSLNYRDLLMARGEYDPRLRFPIVPLSDGVGEVVAVGSDVTRARLGDRVAGIFAQRWLDGEATRERLRSTLGGPLDGMLAEEVVLSEEGIVAVPEHLTDEEAAALPCAAVTAFNALVTLGRVTAGDTVLILGTGGVAVFALQFATLLGARTIVVSGSEEKLERVLALGATDGIHRGADPDWGRKARKLTGGVGVDHVIEVGGAGTLAESVRAVRTGGTISVIGILAGGVRDFDVRPVLMNQIRLQGVLVGSRATFEAMNRAIALHGLRPVVDEVFEFCDAPRAFEQLARGEHLGKIVIRVGSR